MLVIYLLESSLFLESGAPWLPTFYVYMDSMESVFKCSMYHCIKSSEMCCRTVSLRLHPNTNLLAPNFRMYKQIDDNWVEPTLLPANNCHYLQHKGGIVAALSDCHHPDSLVSAISVWKNMRTNFISQTAVFLWSIMSVTWRSSCQFMVILIRASEVFHLLHIFFITK
jgi:hypothetical protein